MKVKEVMSVHVHVLAADDTVETAAQLMLREDIGSVPVHDGDKLIGMVTDRDIVVRGIAAGRDASTPIREIMSTGVKYCYDYDTVEAVARNMAELQVRRLPVVDDAKRLIGFVSLANIASAENALATDALLEGVAQPH
jgi:CBS domain-containing protein